MRNYVTNGCGAFTAFNEVIDYLKNNNYAVLVKDCPQFRAFLLKNDGIYTLKIHFLAKDYCSAYYEKQYEFGERLTAKKIAKIEALMDEAVDNYYEPKTEKVYVKTTDGFTEIEIPSFEGYETMVSTMTDVKTVLEGMNTKNKKECAEKVTNCIETVEKLIDYYSEHLPEDYVIYNNLYQAKLDLELNLSYNLGVNGKRSWIDKFYGRVKELSRGVVRYSESKGMDYGNRYWHIFNPEQDIYEYNGRKFYMWDGWHSSLKVMQAAADRQFNA